MSEKIYPNFLIVGAAKSGTSSLHEYLKLHPDIFMPKEKELYFWQIRKNPNRAIVQHYDGRRKIPEELSDYLTYFSRATEHAAIGEACPSYLYHHDLTISSLKELHPSPESLKIIIILRDPVSRIESAYRFVSKQGFDPQDLNLRESLEQEPARKRQNKLLADLFYREVSNYLDQVKAYVNVFSSVKVVLYDDLRDAPQALCENLCEFLAVDPSKLPQVGGEVHNQAKTHVAPRPGLKAIHRIVGPIWKKFPEIGLKRFVRERGFSEQMILLSSDDRDALSMLYEEYLPMFSELEQVASVDLSRWKKRYEVNIANLKSS